MEPTISDPEVWGPAVLAVLTSLGWFWHSFLQPKLRQKRWETRKEDRRTKDRDEPSHRDILSAVEGVKTAVEGHDKRLRKVEDNVLVIKTKLEVQGHG